MIDIISADSNISKMRLESAKLAMAFLPISCIAYGWLSDKRVHIAAICVALFFSGFFSMYVLVQFCIYILHNNLQMDVL